MHDNNKFATRFIGLFKVFKHIGKLAYRIKLSTLYFELHIVFHNV